MIVQGEGRSIIYAPFCFIHSYDNSKIAPIHTNIRRINMSKNTITNNFKTKLEELEQQKKQLIENRIKEVAALVEKLDLLSLDTDLIIGALSLAKHAQESKDQAKLEELRSYIPSRFQNSKRASKKSDTKAA
jgi:replicative DNA helicase